MGNQETMEILKNLGFVFYDDDSFDYWYKDGILFYHTEAFGWCARLSSFYTERDKSMCIEYSGIETENDILEAIDGLTKLKNGKKI